MAKSFHVDLADFALHLPIGGSANALERILDVIDVTSVLIDEGFSCFEDSPTYHRIRGHDLNGLRQQIVSASLGIPRHATVSIKRIGNSQNKVLVTFQY